MSNVYKTDWSAPGVTEIYCYEPMYGPSGKEYIVRYNIGTIGGEPRKILEKYVAHPPIEPISREVKILRMRAIVYQKHLTLAHTLPLQSPQTGA